MTLRWRTSRLVGLAVLATAAAACSSGGDSPATTTEAPAVTVDPGVTTPVDATTTSAPATTSVPPATTTTVADGEDGPFGDPGNFLGAEFESAPPDFSVVVEGEDTGWDSLGGACIEVDGDICGASWTLIIPMGDEPGDFHTSLMLWLGSKAPDFDDGSPTWVLEALQVISVPEGHWLSMSCHDGEGGGTYLGLVPLDAGEGSTEAPTRAWGATDVLTITELDPEGVVCDTFE